MDFNRKLENGDLTIYMKGRFTFSDHEKFRGVIDDINGKKSKSVFFDFSDVDFLDSAALGMLLIAKEEAEKHSIPLALCNIEKVRKMLSVAKFDNLFKII